MFQIASNLFRCYTWIYFTDYNTYIKEYTYNVSTFIKTHVLSKYKVYSPGIKFVLSIDELNVLTIKLVQ